MIQHIAGGDDDYDDDADKDDDDDDNNDGEFVLFLLGLTILHVTSVVLKTYRFYRLMKA